MKLLGLRLCEHDSNISYFDGSSLHYYKSERKYQVKHHAIHDLIKWRDEINDLWNLDYKEIDEIGIVIDPWRHNLPTDNENFFPAIEGYEHLPSDCKVYRIDHHYAHALSCFPIEKKKSNIQVVIDGFGDENIAWTVFKNDKILKQGFVKENGSLGVAMCKFGEELGIKFSHDLDIAGKLMGLQSYGNIDHEFKKKIIDKYTLYDVSKFFHSADDWVKHLNDDLLLKLKPLDWIRTIHDATSEILIKFFEDITDKNYNEYISYSGGVALNVIWNTALKSKFKNLVIPPHCNDEGLSLGAIEYLRIKNKLKPFNLDEFPFCQLDEKPKNNITDNTIKEIASLLSKGNIVATYQGNGEIGPRALGNRSILMDPTIAGAKEKVNSIKKRENYRPFGCSILKEFALDYFNVGFQNDHMLYIGEVKDPNLKSITHIDGTCRFQTIDKSNKYFYNLIKEFYKLSGCPILLNTSFNINGKPILSSIEDAIKFYNESKIDYLVVGDKIYNKKNK